ncbi:MAG: hypothetical protein L6Q71_11565, partial [Planctomycetes bacterium]|nr:hypothetical protein [Planctomycetota bacterium]
MPNSPTKSVRYTRVIKPVTGERRRVICPAMRQVLAEGYGFGKFRSDLLAGLVVGIVALPLAMALAIASGVPPQYGLYTVMLAAPAIAIFGGSRVNVSGPTAAFVVLLAPIAAEYGVGGLAFASLLAGVLLLIMGISGLGRLIQYVPHPVTTGFTAGIAVVIATLQLKDFFGLSLTVSAAAHMPERVAAIAQAFPSWQWDETVIAAFTLVVLIVWPRVTRKIPGPLVAVTLAAFLAMFLETYVDGASIETIRSRFSYILPDGTTGQGIPAVLPAFALPWNLPGPDGAPLGLSFDLVSALLAP